MSIGIGVPQDAEAQAGNGTIVGLLKRLRTQLTSQASQSAGATSRNATVTAVATATWTTIVSYTPAADDVVETIMADLAALLGVRYQIRVLVATVIQVGPETVHTDQPSAMRVGLRVASGQLVELQVKHAEATAQDVAGTMFTRAA